MAEITSNPKIFISYSWSSPDHEQWVIDLAKRLMGDGIDVTLDKWSLREGQDKFAFMESFITSEDINKVLIICDKTYTEKANGRKGGAGTEAEIITPKIYEKVNQVKFIPVISERDEEGEPYVPTFKKSRIYIDLSNEKSEDEYEKLIRCIYNKPLYTKPSLGNPPVYIREESINNAETRNRIRDIYFAHEKNPHRMESKANDFIDGLLSELKQYSLVSISNNEIISKIVESIEKMIVFRNDYIEFVRIISEYPFCSDLLVNFFEKLYRLTSPSEGTSSYLSCTFDNYKFLVLEFYLYTILLLNKKFKYMFAADMIYRKYYLQRWPGQPEFNSFDEFRQPLESIDDGYKKLTNSNRTCITSDILINRIPSWINRNELIQTDILLCYLSLLHQDFISFIWFPVTYIYNTNIRVELLARCESKRHFENVKILLGFDSPTELKTAIDSVNIPYRLGFTQTFHTVPAITNSIETKRIYTVL